MFKIVKVLNVYCIGINNILYFPVESIDFQRLSAIQNICNKIVQRSIVQNKLSNIEIFSKCIIQNT